MISKNIDRISWTEKYNMVEKSASAEFVHNLEHQ